MNKGGYDGNPYASEQGPADEEQDEIVNCLERAIEALSNTGFEIDDPRRDGIDAIHEALDLYKQQEQRRAYVPDSEPLSELVTGFPYPF